MTPHSFPVSTHITKKAFKLSEFDGDRKKWREWALKTRYKIKNNMTLISRSQNQTQYLFNKLTKRVTTVTILWMTDMKSSDNAYIVLEVLLEHLESVFRDSGRIMKTMNKLRILKQENQSFGIYLMNFIQTLTEAEISFQKDNHKITALNNSTFSKLFRLTAAHSGKPMTFEGLAKYYQETQNALALVNNIFKTRTPRSQFAEET